MGKNYVTPRGLKSHLVNKLVQVQGIVTKMTMVKPMMQTSVHYCEATKRGHVVNYSDRFNLAQLADGMVNDRQESATIPNKDAQGNPLSTEYGYCIYKDH